MKVAKGSLIVPLWFEPNANEYKLDSISTLQLYKALVSKQNILLEPHDTTQHNESLESEYLTETVDFIKKFKDYKNPLRDNVEAVGVNVRRALR